MTSGAVRATYKGAEVWNAPIPSWASINSPSEPFTIFRYDDLKGMAPRTP
jgi:hypothetical protein